MEKTTTTEKSNAEVAAALAREVIPKHFTARIKEVGIVTAEKYNPERPAYSIEHECEAISERDVCFGITEILKKLATKGTIAIVDPPELDEILMGGSRAVARCGSFYVAFTSYWDFHTDRHSLKISCWYRPVSVMMVAT